MGLRIAIQMDPIAAIVKIDTTLLLAIEAQRRGHELFYYTPDTLSYNQGRIVAQAQRLHMLPEEKPHHRLEEVFTLDLREVDVVLMRQDPPFNMQYITATYLLEQLQPDVLVVNDPVAVRDHPEKIIPLRFPDYITPTLISTDIASLKAFRQEHQDIVIKPLNGYGSNAVFRIKPDDGNFESVLYMCFAASKDPVIVQRYIPAIENGEMRVFALDGKVLRVMRRTPAKNQIRNRMDAGAVYSLDVLTPKQQEICEVVALFLKENNILLAALDVIGDYLSEVNVTSVGSFQMLKVLDKCGIEGEFWDAIERRM